MTPIARRNFVVIQREDVAESKVLHVVKKEVENIGRVISSGPDVHGLGAGLLVVFGLGVQAMVGGYLFMRDDNVLAVIDEDGDDDFDELANDPVEES